MNEYLARKIVLDVVTRANNLKTEAGYEDILAVCDLIEEHLPAFDPEYLSITRQWATAMKAQDAAMVSAAMGEIRKYMWSKGVEHPSGGVIQ